MAETFTMSAEDAAAQLGVTVRSVARYCEAGARAAKLKTHDPRSLVCHKDEKTDRTGERWRIDPASVEWFKKAHNITSPVMSRHVQTGLDSSAPLSSPVQTSPDSEAILPLELFKREQRAIDEDVADVERRMASDSAHMSHAREIIEVATRLLDNCARSYAAASPDVRRKWNRALFARVIVSGRSVQTCVYREPFNALLRGTKVVQALQPSRRDA